MAVYDCRGVRADNINDVHQTPLSKAYDVRGTQVFDIYEPHHDYSRYFVKSMFTYTAEKTQAFAVYGGKIIQIEKDLPIEVIDIQTRAKLGEITMDVGHGNSCQFSEEFASESDELPLFYVRNSNIWVYRITGSTSELVKKYSFPTSAIGTYVAGFGVDSKHSRIYTASYTTGDYVSKTGKVRICAWDMDDVIDNGNNVYTPAFIASTDHDWWDDFSAIQGCCYHDGIFFVSTGYTNESTHHVVLFDVTTLDLVHTVALTGSEIEGCAWVDDEYMITMQRSNATYKKVVFANL